jgi:hypothetical protein
MEIDPSSLLLGFWTGLVLYVVVALICIHVRYPLREGEPWLRRLLRAAFRLGLGG